MSTPGPLCEPPANKIVEPLTFTSLFSIDKYMYEKYQVIKKSMLYRLTFLKDG